MKEFQNVAQVIFKGIIQNGQKFAIYRKLLRMLAETRHLSEPFRKEACAYHLK
jgi:hypothetical protein